MNLFEARYRKVLRHLQGAYEELLPVTDLTADWTSAVILREGYERLKAKVRQFAR